MTIIADGLLACEDCTIAIAHDDYTGMDAATEARVKDGVERLNDRGWCVIGNEVGFTHRGCDCCLDGLGGSKHELAILSV